MKVFNKIKISTYLLVITIFVWCVMLGFIVNIVNENITEFIAIQETINQNGKVDLGSLSSIQTVILSLIGKWWIITLFALGIIIWKVLIGLYKTTFSKESMIYQFIKKSNNELKKSRRRK